MNQTVRRIACVGAMIGLLFTAITRDAAAQGAGPAPTPVPVPPQVVSNGGAGLTHVAADRRELGGQVVEQPPPDAWGAGRGLLVVVLVGHRRSVLPRSRRIAPRPPSAL